MDPRQSGSSSDTPCGCGTGSLPVSLDAASLSQQTAMSSGLPLLRERSFSEHWSYWEGNFLPQQHATMSRFCCGFLRPFRKHFHLWIRFASMWLAYPSHFAWRILTAVYLGISYMDTWFSFPSVLFSAYANLWSTSAASLINGQSVCRDKCISLYNCTVSFFDLFPEQEMNCKISPVPSKYL